MANESDELKALREELASCKATSDRLRNQLSDAKARAKEVIQRQRSEAKQRASALEEDLRMRTDELGQVKALLRLAADEKEGLASEAVVLKDELRDLTNRVKTAETERDAQRESATQAEQTASDARAERDTLKDQLSALRKELDAARAAVPAEPTSSVTISTTTSHTSDAQQATTTDSSQVDSPPPTEEPESLVSTAEASPENDEKADNVATEPPEELAQLKERTTALSKELDAAKAQLRTRDTAHETAIAEVRAEKSSMAESLAKAEATVAEVKSSLERSETTLREERTRRAAIDAGEKEEAEKILSAKVAEMERLVASKQAEIGRVREKARTYLKELNAEKREMEEKNKQEVDGLLKKLDDERDKVGAADSRADSAAKEIDSCLAVIRDKQKSVQMLSMTVSTLKSNAADAERQMEALRSEFSRYKERARLALEQKESATETRDADIKAATTDLRAELERAQKSSDELRQQALRVREMEVLLEEMRERAERAEAAADLLRSDANGVSTANINQVDRLEERIAALESDLVAERSNVENAELRHATTRMRLEAADKALRVAEMRAGETETALQKRIQTLRDEMQTLQDELKRAKHSAECAQRTAAAAAKALTFSADAPDGGRPQRPEPLTVETELRRRAEDERSSATGTPSGSRTPRDDVSFEPETRPNGGELSSFARAMEDESDRLGLSPRHGSKPGPAGLEGAGASTTAEDVKARDQQIVVLTAQVAELGMLLDDVQQESQLRAEQTALLKEEVKNLDAKLAAAEKLKNGAPFSYLRTIVVRYLETEDVTLLPVICNVLSFSDDEKGKIKALRGAKAGAAVPKSSSYFSLPFLGS